MNWFWIVGILINLVIAYVCYRIAEGKGRNGIVYGIFGFFFSIITLIVVLVVPDRRTAAT
jgi:hypothetical protein